MKKNIYLLKIILIIILLVLLVLLINYINKKYNNKELFLNNNTITVVSGYWDIHNKHGKSYDEWFKNTLHINARYIFFCDKSNNDYITSFRKDYKTIFIDHPLNEFYSKQYYDDAWVDPVHIPSKELGMVWHEKMHLIKLAKEYDGDNATDFYIWIDAGICIYRNEKPPQYELRLKDTHNLPIDKISYSTEDGNNNDDRVSGTSFIIPKEIIDTFHDIYYDYVKRCNQINNNNFICGTDQTVFFLIKKDHPELFHKISRGYGENIRFLYNQLI
jgi:hypothetical protein